MVKKAQTQNLKKYRKPNFKPTIALIKEMF